MDARERLPLGRRCDRSCCQDDNLEILKWLHENGCPMSANACSEAVENESWECLKYLVDNKCPNWEDYVNIIPEWVKQKQRG